MRLLLFTLLFPLINAYDPFNPYNLSDCRNETAPEFEASGKLRVLSWHIHYTTNETDQPRFYYNFIHAFSSLFPENTTTCPFGPNYGSELYEYVCSLEEDYTETYSENGDGDDDDKDPWSVPQRAFFIPRKYINMAWAWALVNQGYLDLFLHPNTGCMHDDHSSRGSWILWNETKTAPTIYVLEFPCNMPATGCNDTQYPGPPSCGCETPLISDAPEYSCVNCHRRY